MTMGVRLSTSETRKLDKVLGDLVGDRGSVGWQSIDAATMQHLTVAEAQLVERAVVKRQAEFASGRDLLRSLLDDDVEILRVPTGAAKLPPGFVGSLSHDDEIVVGVVCPATSCEAVGIDVEPFVELEPDVARAIVRDDDVVPNALTAFVAKEAAYKVWSALGGEMLEHHQVRVTVEGHRYQAVMAPTGRVLHGQIGHAAHRVIACVFSPAS